MYKNIPFLLMLTLIGLIPSNEVFAQSTNVQFRVNMNHFTEQGKFNPASEFVDLAGGFNGWGNPGTMLSDSNNDGIYTANVVLDVGTSVEFKARINGQWNGREEFPGGGDNRVYTVAADGVVEFWYNDEVPPDALLVQIAASNSLIKTGSTVYFKDQSPGNPLMWEWTFEGGNPATSNVKNPVVAYPAAGSYDVTLTIENDAGLVTSRTFADYIRVDDMQTFWWNDAIFYEVFVRSFKDSNGDGRGDFRGLIDNLDYLNDGNPNTNNDLGITGIWLMPVQQSPSYHGYDVTDYRTIENDYGTNADFQEFMQAAHQRGIKVIIDLVMNHTSTQISWFNESLSPNAPKRDWYVWEDAHPGNTGPWGQTVWHPRNGDYYYGVFWGGMPDLNYHTPAVRDEMMDIARFWLEDMNVDGFRLDAVKFLFEQGNVLQDTPATIDFWKDFRTHYKSIEPEAFAVGEAWTATSIAQRYVNDEGLDYCFEFDLANAIIDAINSGNASGLQDKMGEVMAAYPFLQFGTFLTNHDINRVMSILGQNLHKAKSASRLLLTLPGIPYVYYGEEIGMTGVKPDEDIRTPLHWNDSQHAGFTTGNPWRSVNSEYTFKNIAAQQANPGSLWHTYRDFIQMRQKQVALRRGNYQLIPSNHGSIYAFARQYENEVVLVVHNLGTNTASNVVLEIPPMNLPVGNYDLVELQSNSSHTLAISEMGASSNWQLDEISGRTSLVYHFQDETTDIDAMDFPFAISLYPIPTQDKVFLELEGISPPTVPYQILDLTGQVVQTGVLTDEKDAYQMDVSKLLSGMYLVNLEVAERRVVRKLIIE